MKRRKTRAAWGARLELKQKYSGRGECATRSPRPSRATAQASSGLSERQADECRLEIRAHLGGAQDARAFEKHLDLGTHEAKPQLCRLLPHDGLKPHEVGNHDFFNISDIVKVDDHAVSRGVFDVLDALLHHFLMRLR